MSRRQRLLRQLSAAQFAMWELHLYLDTHPSDMTAAAMHAKYQKRYEEIKSEFECEFGPLSPPDGEGVEWLKNPWPWDIERGDN